MFHEIGTCTFSLDNENKKTKQEEVPWFGFLDGVMVSCPLNLNEKEETVDGILTDEKGNKWTLSGTGSGERKITLTSH